MVSGSCALLLCGLLFGDNPQAASDRPVILRRNFQIEVFRHHPGIIDSRENMQAKIDDAKIIKQGLKSKRISFEYSGGMGQGYTLRIAPRDLEKWLALIEELRATSKLRYYKSFRVDQQGYGLLPVDD